MNTLSKTLVIILAMATLAIASVASANEDTIDPVWINSVHGKVNEATTNSPRSSLVQIELGAWRTNELCTQGDPQITITIDTEHYDNPFLIERAIESDWCGEPDWKAAKGFAASLQLWLKTGEVLVGPIDGVFGLSWNLLVRAIETEKRMNNGGLRFQTFSPVVMGQ